MEYLGIDVHRQASACRSTWNGDSTQKTRSSSWRHSLSLAGRRRICVRREGFELAQYMVGRRIQLNQTGRSDVRIVCPVANHLFNSSGAGVQRAEPALVSSLDFADEFGSGWRFQVGVLYGFRIGLVDIVWIDKYRLLAFAMALATTVFFLEKLPEIELKGADVGCLCRGSGITVVTFSQIRITGGADSTVAGRQ